MKKSIIGKITQNHFLTMVLCCAIPLGLIAILSLTGRLGSWDSYALILLCPALHVLMMRGHFSSADHAKGNSPAVENSPKLLAAPDIIGDKSDINKESTLRVRRENFK